MVLAGSKSDLNYYTGNNSKDRYYYALMIANTWFKIIDKIYKKGKSLAKLREALTNKTMVGEYVGNFYHQHLIKYNKETIVFYSIVDNESSDKTCLLPEEYYEIFTEYEFDCVPFERIGMFDNIESLSDSLFHENKIVSEASIKNEEEGAVIYFIRRGLEDDKVISLAKLKTLEYRIFRKLREKLRNFWAKHENIESWNSTLQNEYDKSFNLFIKECKELIKGFDLPNSFEFYKEFADHAYNSVQNDISYYEQLCNYYVEFLETITKEFEYDPKIFSSFVFSSKIRKNYTKILNKELKADNDSWAKRKPNTSYYVEETRKDKRTQKQQYKEAETKTKSEGKNQNVKSIEIKKERTNSYFNEEIPTEEVLIEETEFVQTKAVTFIMAMTIPGSGKTKLKTEIINELSSRESKFGDKIKFLHLSSDDIRAELVNKRMEETKETREKAFDATQKTASKEFNNKMNKIIDEIIDDKEFLGYAVFLDKNILPNQFDGLTKQLTSIKEKLSKENIKFKIIGLIPECMHGKEDDKNHPFSYNYLLQTYLRTHLRKNHPTIIQGEWYLKPVQISCFFFKQFNKVEFQEKDGKFTCIDHKSQAQMEFDEFQYITFTCESEVFSPPQSFIDCTNEILQNRSKSVMCEDETLLERFYNCVEFYRDAFSFKEGEYNNKDVQAVIRLIDTKGPDLKIVRHKPVKITKSNENLRSSSKRLINAEVQKAEVQKTEEVKDDKHSQFYQPHEEVKARKSEKKLNKLEEKNKDIKTQEEIMLEEEKIDKECTGLDQKTKDDLQKDGFKIVEAKDQSKVKNKLRYYSMVYLGLRVEDDNPNKCIDDFVKMSLMKLSQKFESLKILSDEFEDIENLGWKRPPPPYHITSLFVNRIKKNLEKEEFKKFKEGIYEQCAIKGFIIVEDYIMTSLVFPVSVPIENKVPHLTLYINQGKPYDSNMILENLIINKKYGSHSLGEDILRNFFRENMNSPDMLSKIEEIRQIDITLPKEKKKRKW